LPRAGINKNPDIEIVKHEIRNKFKIAKRKCSKFKTKTGGWFLSHFRKNFPQLLQVGCIFFLIPGKIVKIRIGTVYRGKKPTPEFLLMKSFSRARNPLKKRVLAGKGKNCGKFKVFPWGLQKILYFGITTN
jgi:hypothetical protein